MFTRGRKGWPHRRQDDPPRRRANKRRGHGTLQNDRPPVVVVIGRLGTGAAPGREERRPTETGGVGPGGATSPGATVNTNEWRAYAPPVELAAGM